MSVNSSSVGSLLESHLFSINSSDSDWLICLTLPLYSSIFCTFVLTNSILLLPLCVLILCHGLQRWKRQRSPSTATATHSDTFTYHLVAMELTCVIGYISYYCSVYGTFSKVFLLGFYLITFTWYGETFFHLLTCVECYLAVIHPIIYLSLRKQRGTRIRNITFGCIWLFCFLGTYLQTIDQISLNLGFCLLMFSLIVICFCTLSVLCVLIRPGPGEQGKKQKRFDPSKLRAFYTITAILGVRLLRLTWSLVWILQLVLKERMNKCVWITCDGWVNLPGSLVLPLLFLQRAGKLVCCKIVK